MRVIENTNIEADQDLQALVLGDDALTFSHILCTASVKCVLLYTLAQIDYNVEWNYQFPNFVLFFLKTSEISLKGKVEWEKDGHIFIDIDMYICTFK